MIAYEAVDIERAARGRPVRRWVCTARVWVVRGGDRGPVAYRWRVLGCRGMRVDWCADCDAPRPSHTLTSLGPVLRPVRRPVYRGPHRVTVAAGPE
jgi:hypothetical protein